MIKPEVATDVCVRCMHVSLCALCPLCNFFMCISSLAPIGEHQAVSTIIWIQLTLVVPTLIACSPTELSSFPLKSLDTIREKCVLGFLEFQAENIDTCSKKRSIQFKYLQMTVHVVTNFHPRDNILYVVRMLTIVFFLLKDCLLVLHYFLL